MANIKFEVILKMFFLKLSNAAILLDKKYIYKSFLLLIKSYLLSSKF